MAGNKLATDMLPIWKRWWFIALVTLGVIGGVASAFGSSKTHPSLQAGQSTTVATTTTAAPSTTVQLTTTSSSTTTSTTSTTTSTTSTTTTTIAPVVVQAFMPDVACGTNLQVAQNMVQDAGVFYSRSVDATGKGRLQVIDSNWTVVGQQPAAGTPIGEGDAVFFVLKNSEFFGC